MSSQVVEVSVRPAREDDGPSLADIEQQTGSPDVQPAPRAVEQEGFFDSTCRPENVLVAELEGRVIGYVRLEPVRGPATASHVQTINGIAVAPSHQRRGVGAQLLNAAVDVARERRAGKVLLHVLSTNHAAVSLYRRQGFEQEGCLRAQFKLNGAYVDDLIMARHLAADP